MKPGSVFINAARGTGVWTLRRWRAHWKADTSLGAAIDVFPKEPKSNDETFRVGAAQV
jgi:D-3-phosphoglycerate dehydrogenase